MFRRELTPSHPPPRLRFGSPLIRMPLTLLAAGWLLHRTAATLWWLLLHPRTALWLAAALTACGIQLTYGWTPYAWTGAVLAVTLGVWWARFPDSFRRHITLRLLARWRWLAVYRRDWQPAMVTTGLSHSPAHGATLPRLGKVTTDGYRDRVRVRMLPGQTVDQWRAACPRLAATFQVRTVRIQRLGPVTPDLDLICQRRPPPVTAIPAVKTAVIKTQPQDDPQPATPPRGAFPRQPRGAS